MRSRRSITEVVRYHNRCMTERDRAVERPSLHRTDLLDETELLQTERQGGSRWGSGQSKVEARAVLRDGHQMGHPHGTGQFLGVVRQRHLAILGILLEAGGRVGEHHLPQIGHQFDHL